MADIVQEFKNIEKFPFNCACWDMVNLTCVDNYLTKKTLQNLEKLDEGTSAFQNFVYYTTAMHSAAFMDNDITTARNIYAKYMQYYKYLMNDDNMKKYKIAFQHILLSYKASLFYTDENNPKSRKVLNKIPKFDKMDDANRAAIFGTKAAMLFEFSPFDSTMKGCELARLAISLDPEQAEWYFLNGKGLHRNRRAIRSRVPIMPSKEEMASLEQSTELSPTPSNLTFLAECYVDALKVLHENKRRSSFEEKIFTDMGLAALDLFRRAIHQQQDKTPWYIFLRCGMGYLRIPPPFNNYVIAEEYFQLANALKPENGFIHHQLCIVYQKLRNFPRAFKFAKSASDYGIKWAVFDEVHLGVKLSRNHDVLHSLDRNFNKFNDYSKSVILLQKGSFLIFVKRRLDEGLNAFLEGLRLNEHPTFVQNHSLTFNEAAGTFNLAEYLHFLLRSIVCCKIKVNADIHELFQVLQRKFPEGVGKRSSYKIRSLVQQTLWPSHR